MEITREKVLWLATSSEYNPPGEKVLSYVDLRVVVCLFVLVTKKNGVAMKDEKFSNIFFSDMVSYDDISFILFGSSG